MCISAPISAFFFLIGTIVNIIIFQKTTNPDYLIFVGIYQFILLMQVFDFFAWTDLDCGPQNKMATKMAFIQNMLQPVVVIVLLLTYTQVKNRNNKLIVSIVLCAYISIILYKFYYTDYKALTCMKPTEQCKHLTYSWWSVIGYDEFASVTFLTPIVTSFLLLLKSRNFAIIQIVYLLLSFFISSQFYACGTASIFCLFAAGGPLLNYVLMKKKF